MILDSSAVLAILLEEAEARRFSRQIADSRQLRMSVASYLETAIFIESHGDQVRRAMLDTFIAQLAIVLEPVTVEQIMIARTAFARFGKGKHKAGLNFGDCFTYALAKALGEPVLFKGNDFALTDLRAADFPLN